jgi:hypothetical protein
VQRRKKELAGIACDKTLSSHAPLASIADRIAVSLPVFVKTEASFPDNKD